MIKNVCLINQTPTQDESSPYILFLHFIYSLFDSCLTLVHCMFYIPSYLPPIYPPFNPYLTPFFSV